MKKSNYALVTTIILSLSMFGCSSQPSNSDKPIDSTTQKTDVAQEPVVAPASVEAPTPEPEEPPAPAPEEAKTVIPGLEAVDITINLEDWLPVPKVQVSEANEDECYYNSSAIDSDTGCELTYYVRTDTKFNVKHATFSVINLPAISKEDYMAIATGYLGYCATVPYDTADQAKAKQWVIDTLPGCTTSGDVKTLTIGDVEFSLYGNENGVRFLELSIAQ